ncbi:MAG: hypothetical protein IPM45_12795 [Acidimicrobiales bacterium]|nr:hypothetical protein [Acidimicrobiales bacterium]
MSPRPVLAYDPAVLERFPSTRAGAAVLGGVGNGPTAAGLLAAFRAEQEAALGRLADRPVSDLASIVAWRRTFTAFGVAPTRYRNAAEALLRRLTKAGDIPTLGTLVDLGNLLSVRHALPVVVVDLDRVAGGLTVRFATGDERFADLGGTVAERPEPGEVVFVDEDDVVAARRWCWRQSTASAVSGATRRVLLAAEAQHEGGADAVAAALDSLGGLVSDHLPGAVLTTAVLGPDRSVFVPCP